MDKKFGESSSAHEYFAKYKPTHECIEVAQVTPAFLTALPRSGSPIQKFGNQAEVWGSLGQKAYAQENDFVVYVDDDFFIVPPKVFNKLFAKMQEGEIKEMEEKEAEKAEAAPATEATAEAPVSEEAPKAEEAAAPAGGDDGRPLSVEDAPLSEDAQVEEKKDGE